MIAAFAKTIKIRTFRSGQRRTVRDPPRSVLSKAFDELGTYSEVADAFGVSRTVVERWIEKYDLNIPSRPEIKLANQMRLLISSDEDRNRVSQWLMDEGSVTVSYFVRPNYTILVVCGSMNDFAVLSRISSILGVPITSSKVPSTTILPVGAVRVQGAKAYALLETLLPHLMGLKASEAKAALAFFPQSGRVKGRHTTDELFLPVWKEFAIGSLRSWNARRRKKLSDDELVSLAGTWVEGRIKRAHRFIDSS
ncbi:MAG: hypothetical protein OK452_04905 [Thaumarchaeota archaeon]|nr:hypothetical protein [Nitrososphaerota archaeon]